MTAWDVWFADAMALTSRLLVALALAFALAGCAAQRNSPQIQGALDEARRGNTQRAIDWLQPLAAPTIIVAWGPRRMSDAMSTTYDTDMFEPLAIGKCTLNADVSDESRTKKSRGRIGVTVARGTRVPNVTTPRTMTPTMYQRAFGGSSRSKAGSSIDD